MNEHVKNVIIIPSYCETLALPTMLSELQAGLTELDVLIIMDDSPQTIAAEIDIACRLAIASSSARYLFINNQGKSGRGAAIRRGMEKAVELFPKLEFVIECDADGSHQPVDILRVKESKDFADLLVGSRYLPDSKIVGWPLSRRIFSLLLNRLIPRILDLNLSDITNGLRRYSTISVKKILNENQENSGFIYLSEQALIVHKSGLQISELPIEFIDRIQGKSTVTWREVTSSVKGIVSLISRERSSQT